ncbi:FAD-binding domain [Bradyrhizobium sp. CCGUVB23]|uniref:FAD-binding domain n=1 Tax=Bradyrhizobium sp. CCGUVB23 TaxID=2949630 RepID=UPI0020B32D61|nr:FAD-binding domain [Bradyrhizobium sp. CCGUVB23]MCP3462916.1 FAD-binding domain [Bradyrhizobium sp. CCGUVB23]
MSAVLISGAGIAGATLAFWLKAGGFEPTLIERAPALRTGGYVIDFWGLGYDIAERMGLIGEINRIGYHVQEMRIVDDAGRRIAGFGTRVFSELTGGRYVTLQRSDLSRLLFESIKGDTETLYGDEIVAIEERSDHVRVELKYAGPRRYDYVVGADGLHSAVRKLAFGPQSQFETDLGYRVAAFEARGYHPRDDDVYLIYGQPGRMIGRFTLRDDRTLFLLVFLAADADLPATQMAQKAMLRDVYRNDGWECASMLAEIAQTNELYFDRVSQIRMPEWSRGRIALVGDAAFCVSLLAGQGSALAMISAYVLAGELAAAQSRYEQAFGRYEALLRSYIATKQRGAVRFAGAFAPQTQIGVHVRNLVVRAFAIPGVARLVVGRDIADKLQLPDYEWPTSINWASPNARSQAQDQAQL